MHDLKAIAPILASQHRRLLEAASAIERIVGGEPPRTFDQLATLRWSFTRDLLLHFAYVQTRVIEPLLGDMRLPIAQMAARSSTDLAQVHVHFQRHAMQWQGLPPAENWTEYGRAIRLLMRRTRVRLAGEETQLYPAFPVQPGGERISPGAPPVDYAAQAWQTRRLIFTEAAAAA